MKSALQRYRVDGLLALSLLAALPLVAVFCSDLWFRSDFRFFPLLMIVPVGIAVWRCWRPASESADSGDSGIKRPSHRQRLSSLGLWVAGGLSVVLAPFLLSPWLALLGLTLAWTAWLLTRYELTPWPRLLKWTLPLAVLLLLPLGERSNPVPYFSSNVTYASSSLLDLLGVDHLPSEQSLQLSAGRYDVAAACRGLGNPFLLFSLVVLLCMGTRCSLSVGLLTAATAPLWSWGATVLLVVSSAWLADQQDVFIWSGGRLYLAQAIVVIGGLGSALLIKWGLQNLLAPFEAHSAGVGAVHKFFNRVVLWPAPDPLRMRRGSDRSRPSAVDAGSDSRPSLLSRQGYVLGVVAGLFIAGGTVSVWRLMGTSPDSWPNTSELMTHARFSQLAGKSPLSQATLPEELLGMRQIGFEQFATPGTTTGNPMTNRWTYINEKQTVIIQSDAAYRGAKAIERQRLLDGSRLVERQPTVARQPAAAIEAVDTAEPAADVGAIATRATEGEDSNTFHIESLTLDNPIEGRTYLAYTNLPIDGGSQETLATGEESISSRLRSAVAYRPSSACVSLWLDGSTSQTKDEQEQLQQMLIRAAQLIRAVE